MRSLPFLVFGLAACGARPDPAADRAELLRLHQLARTAHFERRADLLVSTFADSFLNISRGAVSLQSPEESRTRFQAYFDRSSFQEWDDLAPPHIRISPRDSLGWERPEHTVYAWLEVYEKRDGRWTLMAVASTDRPGTG